MPNKVKKYQDLNNELNEVLSKLQNPDVNIDDAIELFEQGQKLIKDLEVYLNSAENRIKFLQNGKN